MIHPSKMQTIIDNDLKDDDCQFQIRECNDPESPGVVLEFDFCCTGGCTNYQRFDSKREAEHYGRLLTKHGYRAEAIPICRICSEGEDRSDDFWICRVCGSEKKPTYDEHPGLANFCPNCPSSATGD